MQDYALVKDLLYGDLGFCESGPESSYLSDFSVTDAFKKAIADSFLKKLCPLGDSKIADERALKKFLLINEKVGLWEDFSVSDHPASCFWDYFKNNLQVALGWTADLDPRMNDDGVIENRNSNFDLDFIRSSIMCGPGAAQLADASTMMSKLFDGKMSWCNDEHLIRVYRSALSNTGLWAEAEMLRFQRFGFSEVAGGKLFFAKKNADISRTCCTEANVNMLVQKAIGDFIELRLKVHFGISLDTQPDKNREMARRGSIDGSIGTIDMVSASDSIAYRLFEKAAEDNFLKGMVRMSRSKTAVLPDGSSVDMNMISTMGNGFTFPLQTLIFACTVRAVYQMMGFPSNDSSSQFGVFGDDIVVRCEAYNYLSAMLVKLGFEVNEGKSFNTGSFRESCGEDYFRGVNVRGVFIRTLETRQSVCSAINRLHRWSSRSGIRLPRTMKHLVGLLGNKMLRVPPSASEDSGVQVPFTSYTPKSVTDNYWFSYQYYRRRTRKIMVPEPDDAPNPPGYGASFLSGHTRRADRSIGTTSTVFDGLSGVLSGFKLDSIYVSLRDMPDAIPRYRISREMIPFWDYFPLSSSRDTTSYDIWKDVVAATLAEMPR